MVEVLITDKVTIIAFWLAFVRWVTTLYQLPIFDSSGIPEILKILFSLIMTYAFFPYVSDTIKRDMLFVGIDNFWLLTAGYTIIGLMIGYLIQLVMNVYIMAGALITQNIGISASRYFDPTFQSIGPFEKFIQETMIVLIISSGALVPMLKGVFLSFHKISFYNFVHIISDFQLQWFLDLISSLFVTGLVLASPIIIIQFLITVVMGIVSRLIPQMNILMISFILNICFGFIIFTVISNDFFQESFEIYMDYFEKWFLIIS